MNGSIFMVKKVSRRSFLKRFLQLIFLAAGSGTGVYYYAREIETRLLKVSTEKFCHPLLPSGFNGCRIVQFSDTHLGFHYGLDQLESLINKINSLAPDLVFFTGDLMDEPNKYEHRALIAPLLSTLRAPLGKYCIFGNHDHGGYGSEIYRAIMEKAGFTILQNDHAEIKLLDNSSIFIAGIDEPMLGKPNFQEMLKGVPKDRFKILLSHAPDLADQALEYGFEWQLSGHSHGGQIKIPFIGALVTPPFAEKYNEGRYHLKNREQTLTLYVNRGIGTTRLPFRFMAKPEITLFQLESKK
jgi:predicted MPP superfamily phosphohydrolase